MFISWFFRVVQFFDNSFIGIQLTHLKCSVFLSVITKLYNDLYKQFWPYIYLFACLLISEREKES